MVKIRKGLLGEMDVLHRRMERMMENVLHRHGAASDPAQWYPAADLYETESAVVVLLEVAGVDPESLEVTLEGTVLRVQGRRGGPPPRRKKCHDGRDHGGPEPVAKAQTVPPLFSSC